MTEAEFAHKYKMIINHIAEIIEKFDINGDIEIDINSDILTMVNDAGTYVINKQSALKEIWLSSPVSGPYHFAWRDDKWQNQSNIELFSLLTKEFGCEIKLDL
jgi:CyaY protein